jgi:hypothetical protein
MAEVHTQVSEKPCKNLMTKLQEWAMKQATKRTLGLDETGKMIGVPSVKTPEPTKVEPPFLERTTAGDTATMPQPTLQTKNQTRPPLTPMTRTVNPERFLQ